MTRPAQFHAPATAGSTGAKLFAQRTLTHVSGPDSPSKQETAAPATKPKPPPVAAKPKFSVANIPNPNPPLPREVLDARRTDLTVSSDDGDRFDDSLSEDEEESSSETSSGSESDTIRTDVVRQAALPQQQFLREGPLGGPPPPLPVNSPPQTPENAIPTRFAAPLRPAGVRGPPMSGVTVRAGPPPRMPGGPVPRAQRPAFAHYDPMNSRVTPGPLSSEVRGRASIASIEDIDDIDDAGSEYYDDRVHEVSASKETTL